MSRILHLALRALPFALLATHYVTMRTVFQESGWPSYGFPLPAFGFTGVSSGEVGVAIGPLAVDVIVALMAVAPLVFALERGLPPRALKVVVGAAWALAVLDLLPLGFLAAVGAVHFGVAARTDWPVECRTVWVGPIQPTLDYEDLGDPCVRVALERLGR